MRLVDWLSELPYELVQGSLDREVNEVIYDSRKAAPGAVFVCMRGANVDSHRFAGDVTAKGVKVLVTEREVEVPEDVTVLKVKNGRSALAYLAAARFGYPLRKMTSIGVTGTKGKTTTTYMIRSILEAAGKKAGVIGTNGAVIGGVRYETKNTTPESYELQEYFAKMVEAGCQYLVMEVSSQGIMMHRVDGMEFDYGLFLNISPDHIGPNEHKDFEEYFHYKKQLLNRCRVGLVNRDDPKFHEITDGVSCQLYTFAVDHEADFMAKDIKCVWNDRFVGTKFSVAGRENFPVAMSIPGRFNVLNGLAALAVAGFLGLPEERICHGLEHIHVDGRMEIAYASPEFTVIVDYAHNAVSMESLLKTLREYSPKRLVCVFGCGGNRARDRRYSMGDISGRMADLSIITADNSRFERVEDILADIKSTLIKTGGAYEEIPDRREAIFHAVLSAKPGDMIAVIGKGHEDYQEIQGVRHHFLDREVVEEAVRERLKREETGS